MSIIDKFTNQNYLFATNEKFKYWYLYLPLFGAMVFLAFLVSMVLKRQDEFRAKQSFERQFFWTYLIFGILGLSSVFARSQNLPAFGSRIFTFIILTTFLATNVWLLFYYETRTKKEVLKLRKKMRKEKWLKKK